MLSPPLPQLVKCGYGTLRSTQGIGVAEISRFVVEVKDFLDDHCRMEVRPCARNHEAFEC